MAIGVDDAAVIVAEEAAKEAVKESAEIALETAEEVTISNQEVFESTSSNPVVQEFYKNSDVHKVELNDVRNVVNQYKGESVTRQSELLGDRLSRIELENRGNKIIEAQPRYGINPETHYPYRADHLVETKPGSSYRELSKLGDQYIASEKVTSVSEKLLVDVKNHSIESLKTNLNDTLEKVNRMKTLSPETIPTISLPEDVATNPLARESVNKIFEAGARIITHAPYENSIRTALYVKYSILV